MPDWSGADAARAAGGLEEEGCALSVSQYISIATFEKAPDNMLAHYAHCHAQYEFFLPLTPIPFLHVDDVSYLGEVGWAYSAPSGHIHGVKYDIADISFTRIEIQQQYFDTLLLSRGYESPFPIVPFRCTDELTLYIEVFRRESRKGAARDSGKLYHLSALICGEIIDGGYRRDLPAPPKAGYRRGVRATAVFMNNHYTQPVSLAALAGMCGFSRNYYTACFRAVFGVTPLVYLTKLRVSKAKQLLETTNDPVQSIALSCGFVRTNTFTQAFRSVTGMNPSAYRRTAR